MSHPGEITVVSKCPGEIEVLSSNCAEVVVQQDCPGYIEVINKPPASTEITCGLQGPPGPPRMGEIPFYLTDTSAAYITLVAASQIPFYLSDGSAQYLMVV